MSGRDPLLMDADYANPTPNISATGFLAPSYLRGSTYLQKLEEVHRARVQAQRQSHHHAANQGQPGSSGLPTTGSSLSLHSIKHTSHRGMAFDVIEKAPPVFPSDDDDGGAGGVVAPLPAQWNKDDKYNGLEVLGDGYEVKYTGHRSSSERDHEACSIRADNYMPSQCGVYYFEVLILNRKRDE
jgi:hypothetical protein